MAVYLEVNNVALYCTVLTSSVPLSLSHYLYNLLVSEGIMQILVHLIAHLNLKREYSVFPNLWVGRYVCIYFL